MVNLKCLIKCITSGLKKKCRLAYANFCIHTRYNFPGIVRLCANSTFLNIFRTTIKQKRNNGDLVKWKSISFPIQQWTKPNNTYMLSQKKCALVDPLHTKIKYSTWLTTNSVNRACKWRGFAWLDCYISLAWTWNYTPTEYFLFLCFTPPLWIILRTF